MYMYSTRQNSSHYAGPCMLHMLYLDVPGTEEKLSVEVALLNDVHVSDVHCSSLTAAHTHHGIVLEELTPNGSRTNLEIWDKKRE